MTMVDEHASALVSRTEVRDKLDAKLDEIGALIEAVLVGRPLDEVDRELWEDDPSNEAGARAMMAVAAGIGG